MKIADLFIKLGLNTNDFKNGVDAAKGKIIDFGGQVKDSANKFLGVFGSSLDGIASKLSVFTSGISQVVNTFKFAAAGGQEAAIAYKALADAEAQLAAASAAQVTAQEALMVLQASGTASAEALAAAEAQLAAASAAVTTAQSAQVVATGAVTTATTTASIAMKLFKTALMTTGIGLLVVAVGSLVAYFTKTREGAAKIKVIFAEMGAITRVLVDRFSSFGEGIYKFFSGDFKGSAAAFRSSIGGITGEIIKEAKAAGDLQKQTNALNKVERDAIVIQQERLTKASQLRAEAREEGKTGRERVDLLNEAKKNLLEYYAQEKTIAEGRRDIAIKEAELHKNTGQELTAVEEAKKRVVQIDGEQADAIRSLSREFRMANNMMKSEADSSTKKATEQLEAIEKVNKELEAQRILRMEFYGEKMKPMTPLYQGVGDLMLPQKSTDTMGVFGNLDSHYKMNKDKFDKFTKGFNDDVVVSVDELNNAISNGMADIATTFAEGLGSIFSDDFNAGEFGKNILSSIGKFMVSMGQMLIAYGMAMDAFKKAFTNPWAAIGAGIALVAIGSAISNSAKSTKISSGTSAVASGYTNYNKSSGMNAFDGNVTFELQGTKLVGVLNNTDRKNNLIR